MHGRRRLLRTAAVTLGLLAVAPAGALAADAPTRYTLANGCYALQSTSGPVVAGADHVSDAGDDAGQLPALPPGPHLPGRAGRWERGPRLSNRVRLRTGA